jgi:hypothetical protein
MSKKQPIIWVSSIARRKEVRESSALGMLDHRRLNLQSQSQSIPALLGSDARRPACANRREKRLDLQAQRLTWLNLWL